MSWKTDYTFGKRYYPLLDCFFKNYYHGHVFIDGSYSSDIIQKRIGIDLIALRGNGTSCSVEIKTARWKGFVRDCFLLETQSCTNPGFESYGWMKTSHADFLLYCFETQEQGLDVYLIDFPALCAWFWTIHEKYETFRMDSGNRTECRIVPIADVIARVSTERFTVASDGTVENAFVAAPVIV